MLRKGLFFAAVALVGASPLALRVDHMFERWNDSTPGLVIAATKNDTIVLQQAFGSADLRFRLPMRPDSRFNVGSVAKQFTAFAIFDLAESHRIGLDDPIGKYVPGLSTLVGSITIRELLEHTSGLRDYFALTMMSGLSLDDALDTSSVLRLANAQATYDFSPGTDYEYSNTNYVLLAEVVRHVTGRSLAEYLRAHVFLPLHMYDSRIVVDHGVPIQGKVTSYWPASDGSFLERHGLSDVYGDSNLVTTARDLLRWEDNFHTKRVGGAVIDRMMQRGSSPGSRPAASRFINGLYVDTFVGVERVSADGGIEGYRAQVETFRSARVSIVVLTNLISLFPSDEVDTIALALLGIRPPASAGPPSPGQSPSPSTSLTSVRFEGYQGRYYGTEVDTTYWLCPDGATLMLRGLRGDSVHLTSIGTDRFSGNTWWLSSAEFVRKNGSVVQMLLSGRSAHGVGFTRTSTSCADAPRA
jgi:CubicO group peptidase (beta-lactamase class C family)